MHFPPVKPEILFYIGQFPVTNSILTSWVAALILLIAGLLVGLNFKRLPSGLQHIFEMVYEIFDNMAQDAMGKIGRKFVPLVLTLFLFIIINNWLGVLPGVGSLVLCQDESTHTFVDKSKCETSSHGSEAKAGESASHGEHHYANVPLFRGGNADLNMTFALALIAQTVVHASGIKTAGLKHHLAHFKNPIEIVTEISKIISFGFRLFGNIYAGEVMLAVMAGLLAILSGKLNTVLGVPGGLIQTPFFMLELFVGFIQAFVFAMLVISFLSLFVKSEEHGHAGGH
jgi:F-type H+-transporting ATPase subunit a